MTNWKNSMEIKIICNHEDCDKIIADLELVGWDKDSNTHEALDSRRVSFLMYKINRNSNNNTND